MSNVIITGASSGIGQAIASKLSQEGYKVYAGVRTGSDFEELKDKKNIIPLYLDVTDQEHIAQAVKDLENQGGIDILINNAGIGITGPVLEAPIEEIKSQFEVNIFGPIRMIQSFQKQLIQNQGHIINISSLNALRPSKFGLAYNMSKSSIDALSETLYMEVKDMGINVTNINPGQYKTSIFFKLKEKMKKAADQSNLYKEELIQIYDNFDPELFGRDADIIADQVLNILTDPSPPLRVLSVDAKEQYWVFQYLINRLNEFLISYDQEADLSSIVSEIIEL